MNTKPRFVVALGVGVIFIGVLLGTLLTHYWSQDLISGMFAVESVSLSSNVHLHRTSGAAVMVTDKEGFGLVYGNVQRAFVDRKAQKVYIEYISHSDARRGLAEIDLKTGKVSTPSTSLMHLKKLKPIDKFL